MLASKETDLLLKAKSEVSIACNTLSQSLSCSTTNAAAADSERGEEYTKEKENTLKNSTSADQLAGSQATVISSQALTSVPCPPILSTKTSTISGTSAISPIERFPSVTGSPTTSVSIHKQNGVPVNVTSKSEVNIRGTIEDSSKQTSVKSTNTSSLIEQSKRISKSLEPLNTTAMWQDTTEEVVLTKGEKGLGFSILDYQVKFPKVSFISITAKNLVHMQ